MLQNPRGVFDQTSHTYRVVLEHAHHGRRSGPLEGVEEAGHGHGDEPDVDQSCLCWEAVSIVRLAFEI